MACYVTNHLAKEGSSFERLERLLIGERTSKAGLIVEKVLYPFVVTLAEVDRHIPIEQ